MLTREAQIAHPPRYPPGLYGGRQQRLPVGLRRHAQRLPDGLGDPLVSLCRQMQPVHVPQPLIAEHLGPVEIHHQGTVPGRQLVDVHEQLLHAGAEPFHHRTIAAGAAHQHQVFAGRRQLLHGLLQEPAHPPHVALGPQGVIEPAYQCDHVRLHRGRHIDLLLDYLADELSAYGEIGVPESGGLCGQPAGEQIGPAAVRAVRQCVGHALRKGITDRDKAGVVGIHLHGGAILPRGRDPGSVQGRPP
jgi:hypothetical protein